MASCIIRSRQKLQTGDMKRRLGNGIEGAKFCTSLRGCDRKRTNGPFSTERTVRSLSITTPLGSLDDVSYPQYVDIITPYAGGIMGFFSPDYISKIDLAT